jgi:dCMP deaminase
MLDKNTQIKVSRPTFDEFIMDVCHSVAKRATCLHRDQGAVIVSGKHIVATGYNGAPAGVKDCLQIGSCSKNANGICMAEGLHGESNAIISAAHDGISINGSSIYCIFSPCRMCCNMIKSVGIIRVYYEQIYSGFPEGPAYLSYLGIPAIKLNTPTL